MGFFLSAIFGIIAAAPFSSSSDSSVPLQVSTSDVHYGPDGPWQAVRVALGDPPQQLDLYPGGTFESIILSTTVCGSKSSGSCGAGGLYNPKRSGTVDQGSIAYSTHSQGFAVDWTLGALNNSGEARYILDQLTLNAIGTQRSVIIPDLSIRMITEVSTTYPDGSQYPLQLGQLALGASNTNQTFEVTTGTAVNGSLLPNYLWSEGDGIIATSSYGLHIGSANLGPPLSLWLGGYDQSRVIGPVNSLPSHNNLLDNFFIDLLDINIGVDNGASPFSYSQREGLLAESNSSIPSTLSVDMNPASPYLSLPNSTCAAIARDLPVTYQPKYGLYTWNVNDPQYERIVTSPTYLGFVFRATNLDVANITIKVPFQLLNLTLDQPLVSEPMPYFPCQPPQVEGYYSLGRAFLQAAFIGVNWDQGLGHWYLAQAPGPDTAVTASQTLFRESVVASSSNWSATWRTHWTPLADDTNAGSVRSDDSTTGDEGLSSGAYAGIGVGCAAAVAAAAAVTAIFLLRRRRRRCSGVIDKTEESSRGESEAVGNPVGGVTDQGLLHEAPAGKEASEVSGGQRTEAWELDHEGPRRQMVPVHELG
ncbi:MAG: hypothetical protein Q9219_004448 [cf. Caloplaca sp. 3 TL-2023]